MWCLFDPTPSDWCKTNAHSMDFGLEGDLSDDEIKKAVWDCGSDKSLGPDGFIFEFLKKFWPLVGEDVSNAVKEFFDSSILPHGYNPSFIALILKVLDAKHLTDFHELISHEESAFIKGRQILDGPLILNEIVSWCQSRKEKYLLFKIDFQKALDSIQQSDLDEIMEMRNKIA
ncbi:hypothetical protein Tco_1221397 [Tanacetum coccineum]